VHADSVSRSSLKGVRSLDALLEKAQQCRAYKLMGYLLGPWHVVVKHARDDVRQN
jgi:hypothetical protein